MSAANILDAALSQLAMRGRVVLCGGIANYNATEPPSGPKNYLNLFVRREPVLEALRKAGSPNNDRRRPPRR